MSAFAKLRLLVTEKCQLDCYYCHKEARRGQDTDQQLGLEGFDKILQAGRLLNFSHVRLSGGEPLICFDLTRSLIEVALEKGYPDVGITTNGILLPHHWPQLQKWVVGDQVRIGVTLNAITAETYQSITQRPAHTMHKTMAGIRLLRGLSKAKIISVVGQRNLGELAGILSIGAELGLTNKLVDMVDAPADDYVSIDTIERLLAELGYRPREMCGDYQIFEKQGHRAQVPHRKYYPRCQTCPLHPCLEGDLAIRVYAGGMVRACYGAPPLYVNQINVPEAIRVLARARTWSQNGANPLP